MPHAALAQAVTAAPGAGSNGTIDYDNAQPLPLPEATVTPPSLLDALLAGQGRDTGESGVVSGSRGTGQTHAVRLTARRKLSDRGVGSQEYGTSQHVYTTSRVNPTGNETSRFYPYRAAGKLFFNDGARTLLCSAALVKRGVVVTAAHCLADFGNNRFYTNWRFAPAYNNGSAPYGVWTAAQAIVLTSYLNGTDSCAQRGVICSNDVGVILLNTQGGAYAGTSAGWLGYGWGGYGFNAGNLALISQLGYPAALDAGALMQRTDSQGFVAPSLSGNTIIGTLQTGGSSGGPWAVNLGIPPTLSGISFGAEANHNVVVGVTSWGYVNTAVKEQGASAFTSSNIIPLLDRACSIAPAACR
jgi:hypothetical protein